MVDLSWRGWLGLGSQGSQTPTVTHITPPVPSDPVPWLWLCTLGVLCCIHGEGAP